jgi:hypothetical protein
MLIFVFAALFYGLAEYEYMSGWKWAVASAVITLVVGRTTGWALAVLVAQVALFCVLWWQNGKRLDRRPAEQAARVSDDQTERRERVRLAHEAADLRRAKEAADSNRPS